MQNSYFLGQQAALAKYAFDYQAAPTPADNQDTRSTIDQAFGMSASLGDPSSMTEPSATNVSQSLNPAFNTPGMTMSDGGAYTNGAKFALASFSPVPPPAAAKVQTAGTAATMNSPKPPQAMAPPGIKPLSNPTSTMPKPSTSGAALKPLMPEGADLPQSATAAQVAAQSLQIGTRNMTTQNPAYKLGEFNREMYPVKAKPGEIKADNDQHQLTTNEMPLSDHRVSDAFNGLKSIKPTDFLNAGNEGTVGALP